jgi:feruloyl esterase
VQDFYVGAYDSDGRSVYPGHALGSEAQWLGLYVPHRGNDYTAGALGVTGDHVNYLFYETDPGVPPASLTDLSREPSRSGERREFAWWQFDIDDSTRGRGDLMKSITDANDPDLTRFLVENDGKLILYHGWSDALITPNGTVEYYDSMVGQTFGGDMEAARERVRLFMIPGMGHCSGGPGPNTWDKLAPLVAWVERGEAPEAVIAQHRTSGTVDNERPIYAYPDRATYSGPAGGQNDPANWVRANFRRR